MSEFPEELSICVVAHASSHKKDFAHEYLLNSILSQDYEHFTVVYIADGFSAEEVQPVKQFIKKRDTDKRVSFVWNNEKKYFLESTVTAVKAFCMEKRVTVLIDGDDELLGTQVFKLLNTLYRRYSANLIYGNFIEFHEVQQQLRVGFSTEYEDS
jgi:glycosyltransferase involved in cell wall biosynthesis